MKNVTRTIITLLFAAFFLTGCAGIAFSPEAAAINATLNNKGENFLIDRDTIEIHQTIDINEGVKVVVLTFQGDRSANRPGMMSGRESCVFAWRIQQSRLGWHASSGGGGCSTLNPEGPVEPLGIGAGQSGSSNPADPGLSEVYGIVYDETITKVRITWMDDQVTEVDVVNSSYIAVRTGMIQYKSVEGFDKDGQSVYLFAPSKAPGKQ